MDDNSDNFNLLLPFSISRSHRELVGNRMDSRYAAVAFKNGITDMRKTQVLLWAAGMVLIFSLVSRGAATSPEGSDKPWLIPPHILEFTGPLMQLFGTNTGFGAKVIIASAEAPRSVKPAAGVLLFREGSTIFEPDSAPVRGPKTRSKKERDGDFGLLVLSLTSNRTVYVVSEGVSGFTEIPFSKSEVGKYAVAATDLGTERSQGVECLKRMVVVQPEAGEPQTFLLWNPTAARWRGFPMRIERTQGGPTSSFSFSDVRFEKPDPQLFTPPQGYQRYDSLNAMTDEMTRRVWNVYRRPEQSIAFPNQSPNTPRAGGTPSRPGGY